MRHTGNAFISSQANTLTGHDTETLHNDTKFPKPANKIGSTMPTHKQDRIWEEAVKRAVHRRMTGTEGKPQKLERLADTLIDKALAGEVPALKEVGDRLDGKAKQQIDGHLSLGFDSDDLLRLYQGAKKHNAES